MNPKMCINRNDMYDDLADKNYLYSILIEALAKYFDMEDYLINAEGIIGDWKAVFRKVIEGKINAIPYELIQTVIEDYDCRDDN